MTGQFRPPSPTPPQPAEPQGKHRSKRTSKRRRNIILVSLLVLIALAAGLVFFTGGTNNALALIRPTISVDATQPKDISPAQDGSFSVSGDKVPSSIESKIVDPATLDDVAYPFRPELQPEQSDPNAKRYFEVATPLFDIGPGGQLKAEMTINVRLNRPLADGDALTMYTNPSDQHGNWLPLEYTLNDDKTVATVKVGHLSRFLGIFTLIGDVTATLYEQLQNGIGSGLLANAKSPTCDKETEAKQGGYSIKGKYAVADTLFFCMGINGTNRFVKIVNNRRYPLEFKLNGMNVLENNVQFLSFAEFYSQAGNIILMPGEEMSFDLQGLKEGEQATIESRLSNWALAAGVADTVFTAIAGAVLKMPPGAKDAKQRKMFKAMLTQHECAKALEQNTFNVTNFLGNCITGETLKQVFDAKGALVAPIVLAVQAAGNIRGITNALADRGKNRDKYTVILSRAKPGPPKEFLGEWGRHGSQLNLQADGTATMFIAAGAMGCDNRVFDSIFSGNTAAIMCAFHGKAKLTASPDGKTLKGSYTETWFTEEADSGNAPEKRVPRDPFVDEYPKTGDAITVTLQSPGVMVYDDSYGTDNTLCGVKATTAERGDCGA